MSYIDDWNDEIEFDDGPDIESFVDSFDEHLDDAIERYESGEICYYCHDWDDPSVHAVDPEGNWSCWRCAEDHGYFSSGRSDDTDEPGNLDNA